MEREADLEEWYQFEMELQEWKKKKFFEAGPADELDNGGGEAGKKKKQKKKPKQKNGKSVEEKEKDPRKSQEGSVEAGEAACGDEVRNRNRDRNSTAGATTGSVGASSTSARRNRRKKTQTTKHLLTPLNPMGEFLRVHSAMLDSNLGHNYERKTSLAPRNLYNLFLRLLLKPGILPNLHDLLCSWYCIQRVVGIVKEADYLPVPGRVKLDANPIVLHKIKTFTIRPPVVHLDDSLQIGRYYPWTAISCELGWIIDAFPNLETLDTCYLHGSGHYNYWFWRPMLLDTETLAERHQRVLGGVIGTSPIKHVRVYWTSETPAIITAFRKSLRPGALETLLVRFHMLHGFALESYMTTPECPLLGHEGLIDSGSDSLRYLELLSTPALHYLTRTEEMKTNPRRRRLTCLPFLNKLEVLVVDFQGLFGDITHLDDEDTDMLHRGDFLPPKLVTLKIACVWSSTQSEYLSVTPAEGEYVVSDTDVAIFIDAFRAAHQAGTLELSRSLKKLALVVPDHLRRLCSDEDRRVAEDRKKKALIEAREYFNGTEVEFDVETGLDVLNTARGM